MIYARLKPEEDAARLSRRALAIDATSVTARNLPVTDATGPAESLNELGTADADATIDP